MNTILENLDPKFVMLIWSVIDNPQSLSLRQWKAIHAALKECGSLKDLRRYKLMRIRTQNPDKKPISDDAGQVAGVDKPDDLDEQDGDARTRTKSNTEDWRVISALCVLESSRTLEHFEVQFRTVKTIVAEVEQHISTALKRVKDQALQHYSKQIDSPVQDLSIYVEPLRPSGLFEFITHLRIVGLHCKFTQQELDVLPALQNLGVLEVIEPWHDGPIFPRVTDDMLQAWSLTKEPFPKLTLLKIHSQKYLTTKSAQYVTKFRHLKVFSVWGKRRNWHIEDHVHEWRLCCSECMYIRQDATTPPKCLQWGVSTYRRFQSGPADQIRLGKNVCQETVPLVSLGLGLDTPPPKQALRILDRDELQRWLYFRRRGAPDRGWYKGFNGWSL